MKAAAVIGANSMLGAGLVSALTSAEVDVIRIGRQESADIRLDLNRGLLSPLPRNARADVIFHCAASFADDSHEGIRKNFQTNTAGCLDVIELSEHLECSAIIYAGSLSSLETLNPGRFTSYGFTKAQAETMLAWGMKRLNRRFCSLRFSQIYDTDGVCILHQPWFGRVIAYAARGLDINMPISEGVRNFLHLDDAVRLMIAAGESSVDEILNVVHPEAYTYEQIATIAFSVFGKGGRVTIDPNKAPFRSVFFPDAALSFRQLGKWPTVSIRDGIARIRELGTFSAFGPLDVA